MPAEYMQGQSEIHDRNLLACLSKLDAEHFWEESRSVKDQFNVCGFSAMACLLEVVPQCSGTILNYQIWHEEATKSAVSYAAVVFSS
jgi:predicted class III extradiol MEMO1 family dioxygenase